MNIKLIQGLYYQSCWFLFLISSHYSEILQLLLILITLFLHYWFISQNSKRDFYSALTYVVLGLLLDQTFIQLKWVQLHHPFSLHPLWLIGMWIQFGHSYNYSLSWFTFHPKNLLCLIFFLGPLAYYAGVKFNIWQFADPLLMTSAKMGIAWLVLTFTGYKIHQAILQKFPHPSLS